MVGSSDATGLSNICRLARPFWLSPRQMAIVPIFPSLDPYAQEVQKKMWDAGFQVDCDLDAGTTLNKKIRQNQLAQYNFIGGRPASLFDIG